MKSNALRMWLFVFLALLIYDGALRKWWLPGGEALIFVLKDVLLAACLGWIVLIGRYRRAGIELPPAIQHLFWLYALWVMIGAVNPHLPNLLVGIWGAKAHLLYASLILLLPLAFSTLDDAFSALAKIYPWVVIPVCVLAVVQVALPADHFLNQQVRGGIEGISAFGDASLVRVTGPFSYISGMSAFVQVAALLGLGIYLAGFRSWPFLAGLGFAALALPVTGSRAVIAIVAVGAMMMLLAAMVARLVSGEFLLRALLLMGILIAISVSTQDEAWNALQERFADNLEEGTPRAISAFMNAFDYFEVAGALGFGSGAANLGAVALSNSIPFSWLPVEFEEESGRLVLELGIVGWGLSLLFRVAVLFWALGLLFHGVTRNCRVAAILSLPFMASAVHQGNGVFAPPFMAVGYWFCLALLAMAQREWRVARAQSTSARPKLPVASRLGPAV